MPPRVSSQIEDGVARIQLDDGKVNALSIEMIEEIAAALDAAEAAGAIALLIGRPGIFSAGFDLGTFQRGPDAGIAMVAAGARLVERLLGFPYPVLCVCTGHAYPAGAFLMMSADSRIGITGSWKIGMNEVAIGLTVPRFAVELARHRLTPPGFARIATATMFPPEEARRFGYLDDVVAPDALDAAVQVEISRLRGLDLPSFAGTKARMNEPVLAAVGAGIAADFAA